MLRLCRLTTWSELGNWEVCLECREPLTSLIIVRLSDHECAANSRVSFIFSVRVLDPDVFEGHPTCGMHRRDW